MPRPNPSHPEDWLDDEIDSLLRSVEPAEEPEVGEAPASAADRASARWFRRPAPQPDVLPARPRWRHRPGVWARTRSFFAIWRGDLGFYALGIAASVILGWLIVVLGKP
jgi:hypothetical protein